MIIGKILAYSDDVGRGVIICEDKNKYNFDIQDWNSFESSPKIGMKVEFELSSDEQVQNIDVASDVETYKHQKDDSLVNIVDIEHNQPIQNELHTDEDLGMKSCVDSFFAYFEHQIQEDTHLRLESKELDFLKMKRFLYTAFNNLLEIDTGFENYILADIKNSLDKYYDLYKRFHNQTKYVKTTFERVFLDKQDHYKEIIHSIDVNKKELANLKTIIETNEAEFESERKKIITFDSKSVEYTELYRKLKTRKRKIVDAIHESTTIKETNRELIEKAQKFYQINFTPFVEIFEQKSRDFEASIVKILNVLAYKLDTIIWENANNSENVKEFFKKAGITTKFSSATYLRYYINSLDMSKLSEENHDLLDLLHYLEKKEQAMVVVFSDEIESVKKVENLVKEIKEDAKTIIATRESILMRDLKKQAPTTFIVNPLTKGVDMEKMLSNFKYIYPNLDVAFLCESLTKQVLLLAKKFKVSIIIQTSDSKENQKKRLEVLIQQ